MRDTANANAGHPVAADFARAIASMSLETFFAACFENRHLAIRRGDPGYCAERLSIGDTHEFP